MERQAAPIQAMHPLDGLARERDHFEVSPIRSTESIQPMQSNQIPSGHLEKLPQTEMAPWVDPDQCMSFMGWLAGELRFFEVPFS